MLTDTSQQRTGEGNTCGPSPQRGASGLRQVQSCTASSEVVLASNEAGCISSLVREHAALEDFPSTQHDEPSRKFPSSLMDFDLDAIVALNDSFAANDTSVQCETLSCSKSADEIGKVRSMHEFMMEVSRAASMSKTCSTSETSTDDSMEADVSPASGSSSSRVFGGEVAAAQGAQDLVPAEFCVEAKAAILKGDEHRLFWLLNMGFNPNYVYEHGLTPLHMAALYNRQNCVEMLVAAGANILATTTDGYHLTPAGIAEIEGNTTVRDLLSTAGPEESGTVHLNIYDVRFPIVPQMNSVFRVIGTGAFHAAVEIHGQEWSFGYRPNEESGVYGCKPRECDLHIYRESVPMGVSKLSEQEVRDLIAVMATEWTGDCYEILRRNCCHFSAALCSRLGVRKPPMWVMNLAALGATLDQGARTVARVAQKAAPTPTHTRIMPLDRRLQSDSPQVLEVSSQLETRPCTVVCFSFPAISDFARGVFSRFCS